MPKFRKPIVSAGKYKQWDQAKQQWYTVDITDAYLQKLVSSFGKMKEKGLNVPAPWKHDLNIHAFNKENGGYLEDSSKNGGFWEKLELEVIEGKPTLVGIIEAPGSTEDPNTPAGKIGKTVKECSIYTRKNVPITDGSTDVIEDAIMHIALVTHPIEPGQDNFVEYEDDFSLAMSQYVEDEQPAPSGSINELAALLKDCCKLFLPENTTAENLVANLTIAVKQHKLLNEKTEDDDNSIVKVDPLIMSHMNAAQIQALIDGKVVNPVTNKPYAKEDFADVKVDTKTELIMSALQTEMQSDRRKGYRSRIDKLISTGRTTKAYADSSLYPRADAYELQIADGKIVESPLEIIMSSLEALPAKEEKVTPPEVLMNQTDDSFDEKKADEVAAYMATLI